MGIYLVYPHWVWAILASQPDLKSGHFPTRDSDATNDRLGSCAWWGWNSIRKGTPYKEQTDIEENIVHLTRLFVKMIEQDKSEDLLRQHLPPS